MFIQCYNNIMNVQDKIKKIENKKNQNHELVEYRKWLDTYLPMHRRMAKIQVGGTNGKGSTIAWMNQLLTANGYKVGVFTSPHLIHHTERICIGKEPISFEDWERIYDTYADLFEEKEFTMFEIDLWMAVAYFLEKNVDVALMEVGLGGRLDATTALDYNLTMITNVGMEHQDVLGDSIEQITYEKSGIFKPGVIALTTETKENSQRVMELVAGYIKAMLGFVEMPYERKDGRITFTWMDHTFTFKHPVYQLNNLALALEGLHQMGYALDAQCVQDVINAFEWNGRFTILRKEPLILVDGAHNEDGIRALVRSLQTFDGDIYFCVLKDKNAPAMLEMLESLHGKVTLVRMDSERLYPYEKLHRGSITVTEMIDRLQQTENKTLICGSLYFVGETLKLFNRN